MLFQECSKGASRVIQECFKIVSIKNKVFLKRFECVSRESQGCFKEGQRKFQKSFKGVSECKGCFKSSNHVSWLFNEVSRLLQRDFKVLASVLINVSLVIHGCFKDLTKVLQECCKGISRVL